LFKTYLAKLNNEPVKFNDCFENPTAAVKITFCLKANTQKQRAKKLGEMALAFKESGGNIDCLAMPAVAELVCKSKGRGPCTMALKLKSMYEFLLRADFTYLMQT